MALQAAGPGFMAHGEGKEIVRDSSPAVVKIIVGVMMIVWFVVDVIWI